MQILTTFRFQTVQLLYAHERFLTNMFFIMHTTSTFSASHEVALNNYNYFIQECWQSVLLQVRHQALGEIVILDIPEYSEVEIKWRNSSPYPVVKVIRLFQVVTLEEHSSCGYLEVRYSLVLNYPFRKC